MIDDQKKFCDNAKDLTKAFMKLCNGCDYQESLAGFMGMILIICAKADDPLNKLKETERFFKLLFSSAYNTQHFKNMVKDFAEFKEKNGN